jgi:hypothetical protein
MEGLGYLVDYGGLEVLLRGFYLALIEYKL